MQPETNLSDTGGAHEHPKDEELFGEEQVPTSMRERILELTVTVLLATAAMLSAWCAYQSTRFGGTQIDMNTAATALRIESVKSASRAGQLALVDASLFGQYVGAIASSNRSLADFYRDRFRIEFRPAFEAWLATDPLNNPNAPKTPFESGAYRLTAQNQADALAAEADQRTLEGERAGAVSDRYVLAVVLFAAALFLLGIQTRLGEFWLRFTLVAIGALLIVGTIVWIATLPRLFKF